MGFSQAELEKNRMSRRDRSPAGVRLGASSIPSPPVFIPDTYSVQKNGVDHCLAKTPRSLFVSSILLIWEFRRLSAFGDAV